MTLNYFGEAYDSEFNTIKFIAQENGYNLSTIDILHCKHKARINMVKDITEKKYVVLEYNKLDETIAHSTYSKRGYTVAFKPGNSLKRYLVFRDMKHTKISSLEKSIN